MLEFEHISNKYLKLLNRKKMSISNYLKMVNCVFDFEFRSLTELNQFVDAINYPRFPSKGPGNSKRVFSLVADFDVIYHDFKVAGICDLLNDDIDWLAFNFHVSGFMNSQSSSLALRVQERQNAKGDSRFPISKSLEY